MNTNRQQNLAKSVKRYRIIAWIAVLICLLIIGKVVYVGTLKRNTLQDLARRGTDHPNFKYNNGVFTSEGVDEKWINGESFTHRHARLLELMREELVLAVEQ